VGELLNGVSAGILSIEKKKELWKIVESQARSLGFEISRELPDF